MSTDTIKPKVLVIGPVSAVGGMATSMQLQLGSALGDQFELVPFDNSKRTPQHRAWWEGLVSQWAIAADLVRLIRRVRPALVHIHTCSGLTFFRTILDMIIARCLRVPVILHIRGGRFAEFLNGLRLLSRAVVRRALVGAECVIVLSPKWADRLRAFDPRINLQVVANGVRTSEFSGSQPRSGPVKVVFVGTTKKAKGADDLIEAVARLDPSLRETLEVRIIGPDPEGRASAIEALIQRLSLQQVVQVAGMLSGQEVRRELEEASIFVLPSYAEAMPNALLEAMACGLPAVVTDVGAMPEVISDGVEGFLVKPGDVAHLCVRVGHLIRNPELRERMGQAARARAVRDFGQDGVVRRLSELYRATIVLPGATS